MTSRRQSLIAIFIVSFRFIWAYIVHFAAAALTLCQKEYQERLRSWLLPGPYVPRCALDGKYDPMQCQGFYCYCVNEHGVELVESRVDIAEGQPKCKVGGKKLQTETLRDIGNIR